VLTDNRQPCCGIDLDQSSSPATRPGGSPANIAKLPELLRGLRRLSEA